MLVGTQSDQLDDEEDSIADRRLWEVSAMVCRAVPCCCSIAPCPWLGQLLRNLPVPLVTAGWVREGDREQALLQVQEHVLLHYQSQANFVPLLHF